MAPKLPLPRGWNCRVRSPVLHVLALVRYLFTHLSVGTTFAGAGLPPVGTTDRSRHKWLVTEVADLGRT